MRTCIDCTTTGARAGREPYKVTLMPNNAQSELRSLIETFATNLEALSRRAALEQVLASLGGAISAPAKRGPGRPKGSGTKAAGGVATVGVAKKAIVKKSKGGRRSAAESAGQGEALLAHVTSNPGQRGEQIAKALGTDVGTMRLPMKKLIAAKKVKTRGQRRGMTYFAAGAGVPAGTPPPQAGKKSRKGRKKSKRAAKK